MKRFTIFIIILMILSSPVLFYSGTKYHNTKDEVQKYYIHFTYPPIICYQMSKAKTVTYTPVPDILAILGRYKVTAYDLSIESCGKPLRSKYYGLTRGGTSLKNKTRLQAMSCAVDPKYIPLGTKLLIIFKNPTYKKYDGVYTAIDTGSGVRGKHIDIFVGDFQSAKTSKEADNFGVTYANVSVIEWSEGGN